MYPKILSFFLDALAFTFVGSFVIAILNRLDRLAKIEVLVLTRFSAASKVTLIQKLGYTYATLSNVVPTFPDFTLRYR